MPVLHPHRRHPRNQRVCSANPSSPAHTHGRTHTQVHPRYHEHTHTVHDGAIQQRVYPRHPQTHINTYVCTCAHTPSYIHNHPPTYTCIHTRMHPHPRRTQPPTHALMHTPPPTPPTYAKGVAEFVHFVIEGEVPQAVLSRQRRTLARVVEVHQKRIDGSIDSARPRVHTLEKPTRETPAIQANAQKLPRNHRSEKRENMTFRMQRRWASSVGNAAENHTVVNDDVRVHNLRAQWHGGRTRWYALARGGTDRRGTLVRTRAAWARDCGPGTCRRAANSADRAGW